PPFLPVLGATGTGLSQRRQPCLTAVTCYPGLNQARFAARPRRAAKRGRGTNATSIREAFVSARAILVYDQRPPTYSPRENWLESDGANAPGSAKGGRV